MINWHRNVRVFSRGILSALAGVFVVCGCDRKPTPEAAVAPAPADTNRTDTNRTDPVAVLRPEFARLKGKWLRPDGGYVLEIRSIEPGGAMQAGYFNPNPINVAKALAIQEGAVTKVFVELRDANYPGCTYSLTYDAQYDHLYGQYFQAAVRETYDITFQRLKE